MKHLFLILAMLASSAAFAHSSESILIHETLSEQITHTSVSQISSMSQFNSFSKLVKENADVPKIAGDCVVTISETIDGNVIDVTVTFTNISIGCRELRNGILKGIAEAKKE